MAMKTSWRPCLWFLYDSAPGKAVRGPAHYLWVLVHAKSRGKKINPNVWTEIDFRAMNW